jgi:hypothetical protein
MNDPIYLLTSVESIPVIVKCLSDDEVEKLSNRRSMILGKDCAKKNIESENWTDKTDSDRIAQIINSRLYDKECWIRVEDAFVNGSP